MADLNNIHSNEYFFHSSYSPNDNETFFDEDEHLEESPCVKKQRGKNKTYLEFKKYPKEVDLKAVVIDLKNYGWIKGKKLFFVILTTKFTNYFKFILKKEL
jgi:hypothetical protein